VAALIARDRAEVRREHVDDLALALVAPLRAQHRNVGLRHRPIFNHEDASRTTISVLSLADRTDLLVAMNVNSKIFVESH
jgi:hypothetical protein